MARTGGDKNKKHKNILSPEKKVSSGEKNPQKLTKDQCYYLKHPEIKEKSRLRMQKRRAQEKLASVSRQKFPNEQETMNKKAENTTYHHAKFFNNHYLDTDDLDTTEYTRFRQIRERVITWCAPWGGVAMWPLNLDIEHQKAVEGNKVDKWIAAMLEHARIGREILHQLSTMESYLPNTAWEVRELWRLEVGALRLVIEGLAVLDIRVNLMNSSRYNLLADFTLYSPYQAEGSQIDEDNDCDGTSLQEEEEGNSDMDEFL